MLIGCFSRCVKDEIKKRILTFPKKRILTFPFDSLRKKEASIIKCLDCIKQKQKQKNSKQNFKPLVFTLNT